MGPRASLDVCEKSRPHRDSIPGPSSSYSVAKPTKLPGPIYIYIYWITMKKDAASHFEIMIINYKLTGLYNAEAPYIDEKSYHLI
jgi:hypothetical protein